VLLVVVAIRVAGRPCRRHLDEDLGTGGAGGFGSVLIYGGAMELADIHDVVATRLRADGQRYTQKRRALVDVLHGVGRPLSMPSILEQSPGMAQSSVYRNLSVLEHASVVRRIVTTDDHASFELAEDLSSHHHHLICSTCGTIEDFVVPEGVEAELDKALAGAARRHRFTVSAHTLDLFGTCRNCAA
jgi:Fe2+ or Zn2+ uptake regulation protein